MIFLPTKTIFTSLVCLFLIFTSLFLFVRINLRNSRFIVWELVVESDEQYLCTIIVDTYILSFHFQVRNLVTSAQVQEHEYAGTHIISSSLLRTSLELTKFIGGDFEYPGM